MAKLKLWFLLITANFLFIAMIVFSLIFIKRSNLSYNSEGKYFDELHAVVYHEQAVQLYGIAAVVCFVPTIVIVVLILRRKKI
jgi:hypothetical protein